MAGLHCYICGKRASEWKITPPTKSENWLVSWKVKRKLITKGSILIIYHLLTLSLNPPQTKVNKTSLTIFMMHVFHITQTLAKIIRHNLYLCWLPNTTDLLRFWILYQERSYTLVKYNLVNFIFCCVPIGVEYSPQ